MKPLIALLAPAAAVCVLLAAGTWLGRVVERTLQQRARRHAAAKLRHPSNQQRVLALLDEQFAGDAAVRWWLDEMADLDAWRGAR